MASMRSAREDNGMRTGPTGTPRTWWRSSRAQSCPLSHFVDGGPSSTAVSLIDAAFNGFQYRSGERAGGKNMGKPHSGHRRGSTTPDGVLGLIPNKRGIN